MADITRLSRLLNGVQRQVSLQDNTLVVTSIKVGGATNTELTKAILDNLVALQNGSDFSDGTNAHTHDGRYYTETELGSNANGEGASLIGIEDSNDQFTATDVEGALDEALDAAQAAQDDIDGFDDGLKNLTADEVQQLQNIDTTTINATQWGYLGDLDQALASTDSPTFAALTVNGNIIVTGTVDGVDVAAICLFLVHLRCLGSSLHGI